MAAFTMKPETGALFVSKNKKNDNSPDYSGNCLVNGVTLHIAGWKCTTRNGDVYLKLSFRPAEDGAQAPRERSEDNRPDEAF